MKKKFKKVTIALIVLLMVIAGTLAWLVTSDFKKGKIGAANFTLDVEAVREVTEDDAPTPDGFTLNDGELAYREEEAKENGDTTTIFHYEDTDMYPISKSNMTAIFDEDKVSTKWIRITNNNDTDAIVELSAYSDDTSVTPINTEANLEKSLANILKDDGNHVVGQQIESTNTFAGFGENTGVVSSIAQEGDQLVGLTASATSRLAGVSWLVGAPLSSTTYIDSADMLLAGKDVASLANLNMTELTNEDALAAPATVDVNNDNDFFYLTTIGYTADARKAASNIVRFDANGDTIADDDEDTAVDHSILVSAIAYNSGYEFDEGTDLSKQTQTNVIRAIDGTVLGLNNKALSGDLEALGNILKVSAGGDDQSTGNNYLQRTRSLFNTFARSYVSNIPSYYVHQTFEDASSTGFAVPMILRAHTSVVIPFKVFLNENWDEKLGSFTYNIVVNARNYTDGDDVTYQNTTKKAAVSFDELATKVHAVITVPRFINVSMPSETNELVLVNKLGPGAFISFVNSYYNLNDLTLAAGRIALDRILVQAIQAEYSIMQQYLDETPKLESLCKDAGVSIDNQLYIDNSTASLNKLMTMMEEYIEKGEVAVPSITIDGSLKTEKSKVDDTINTNIVDETKDDDNDSNGPTTLMVTTAMKSSAIKQLATEVNKAVGVYDEEGVDTAIYYRLEKADTADTTANRYYEAQAIMKDGKYADFYDEMLAGYEGIIIGAAKDAYGISLTEDDIENIAMKECAQDNITNQKVFDYIKNARTNNFAREDLIEAIIVADKATIVAKYNEGVEEDYDKIGDLIIEGFLEEATGVEDYDDITISQMFPVVHKINDAEQGPALMKDLQAYVAKVRA